LMPSKTSIASAEKPPVHDRVDDPFALAVALDVGGDDCRLAVGRAGWADERGVAGWLAGHLRGWASAALCFRGRRDRRRAFGITAGGSGGAIGHHAGKAFRRHLADVADNRLAVRGGEAGVTPENDHGRSEFAFLQGLGRLQRGGRFGVAGQVGGCLVAFSVFELAWQIRWAGSNENHHEPDHEDDPLRPAAGNEGEERALHDPAS
jgi:hypothetical protein